MSQSKYDNELFDLVEDNKTAPYVEMPRMEISPETEVYLRNTSYLSLINDHEAALHLLREAGEYLSLYQGENYYEDTQKLINKIEQFLKQGK